MKKILIIHTGGTISMLENKETGAVNVTDEHPLTRLQDEYRKFANVDEYVVFDLPSPHITPKHMLTLADCISQSLSKYDGIVVTHGTDTLEETAYFLDLVIDSEKPIIITGAMRSSNEIGSDALYNLISSIRVASADQAKNKGVLVVMNDEIHTAANVTKTSTSNVATFQSTQYGPIGIVTKEMIIFHRIILKQEYYPVKDVHSNVFLLKAFAGMDENLIHALHMAKPDGLVIEAFGQGNLPGSIVDGLIKIINDNIPVILVSRCYQGTVQPTYAYQGGGRQLKELGVIFANGLTGPKARIKLLLALEKTKNIESLSKLFSEQ
ncbi:asparaginase [Oceanobacillus alkalisoli]|uniref:asparaginase n=1 Tax=Oceanobacillus alkalisoli TaxID=2925113 RepID=UPI001EEF9D18|nr:asparaginase [Oceanobacillus alkalisoli]MCF3941662.1 asparaginase [Oceanobacillus alkalisoli]MCG5102943.1 asparaginase [Oceanobacillus alkalisoli]